MWTRVRQTVTGRRIAVVIRYLLVSSLLPMACWPQQVSIKPSSVPGLQVVGPDSPDFLPAVAQLVGSDQPPGFRSLLQYGLVIQNAGEQTLAGFGVVWTAAGDSSHRIGAGAVLWKEEPSRWIRAGQSVLVVPGNVLQSPRQLRAYRDGGHLGELPAFQRAGPLTVSVECVVYSSGQFVGADTASEYERFDAEINAPRAIASAVLQRKDTTSVGDIVTWLESVAAPHEGEGKDYNAATSASTARQFLSTYRNKGEAGLYSLAKGIGESPAFPLHR